MRSMPRFRVDLVRCTVTPAHGRVEASSKESHSGILTSDISHISRMDGDYLG